MAPAGGLRQEPQRAQIRVGHGRPPQRPQPAFRPCRFAVFVFFSMTALLVLLILTVASHFLGLVVWTRTDIL